MRKESKVRSILLSLNHYLIVVIIIAFIITCCISLFVRILQITIGFTFTEEQIKSAAILTFINVLGFSAIFTILDGIRRRFIVIHPIKRIIKAAEKMSEGDFTVRIPEVKGILDEDMFNQIGDCFNKMA